MSDDWDGDLFGPGAARNTDPDTSWEAAYRFLAGKATDRRKVLLLHARYPHGMTDFELAERMGRQQTSVGKRRGELRDKGLIEATPLRRNAPSDSPAIVWRITRFGQAVAAELKDGG
jgi:hypothetical protein